MRQKTVITKLLQSVTEVYYKVRQVLQSASGITKCDSYYKVRRNTCPLPLDFPDQLLFSKQWNITNGI